MAQLTGYIEETKTGYSAFVEEVDGVVATGKTLDKLKENLISAVEYHKDGILEFDEELPPCLEGELTFNFKMV